MWCTSKRIIFCDCVCVPNKNLIPLLGEEQRRGVPVATRWLHSARLWRRPLEGFRVEHEQRVMVLAAVVTSEDGKKQLRSAMEQSRS